VGLLDAVLRVCERVRERAVVREQERAGRVDVEPPDGNDARARRDDVDDGAAAVRVARGRDVADRLVQEDDRELLRPRLATVGGWVALGQHDVGEVFEAPDDETALEIITKLGRHGAEETETLRAFTRDEAEEIIRRL